jgi:carboxymethylenebutenolidase
MCHDDTSRPPAPPTVGPVRTSVGIELTAADGNHLAAHEALPDGAPRAGVVVLPDIRGLHPYYVALCERFAEAGYAAVAIDFFGRTAGVGTRDEAFQFRPHVAEVTPEHVRLDAGAAVSRLTDVHGVRDVFTVGFCFGGGHSWRLAATDLPLAGSVGFYGRPPVLEEVLDDVHAPLLLLVAGADRATPLKDSRKLAERLRGAGKEFEMHVYDGAPHSFFDRAFDQWQDACADAWQRIVAFTDAHQRTPA